MPASQQAPSRQPNVLFFFTDDQRFDTIQALGNPNVITPNIDRLVRRGTTFTNGYIMGGSSGAVCMPSRSMLMTGRTLYHIEREGQTVDEAHAMMPETFRNAGYATFGTGKWHNGPRAYHRCFSKGGNIFFGGMSDHFDVPLRDFDPTGEYPQEAIRHEPKKHSSDIFSGSAIEFLESRTQGDAPFFLYLSFTAPHDPRDTHPRYHDMYDPAKIPVPENFLPEHPFDTGALRIRDEMLAEFPRTPEEIQRHIAEYYAMITHIDDRIGDVLETLEKTGEADNTIIVFAGDNGLALGRHGLMGKQNLYDHSVHVPLIMAGPGVPEGEQRDCLAGLIDIFPTLCDLTGREIPDTVEGTSLAPALRDAHVKPRETMLYAYVMVHRGVRDDRYKLIEYAVNGERHTQLFDLREDPFEKNNLAENPEHAEHLKRLRAELERWRTELGDDREGQGADFWPTYDA